MYLDSYAMTSLCTHVEFIEVILKTKLSDNCSTYYAPTSADVDLPIDWIPLDYIRLLFNSFTPHFKIDWFNFVTYCDALLVCPDYVASIIECRHPLPHPSIILPALYRTHFDIRSPEIVQSFLNIMHIHNYSYTMTCLCTHVEFIEVTLKTKLSDNYSTYYAPTSADVDLPIDWIP